MKKKILGIALLAVSLVSLPSLAQQPQTCNSGSCSTSSSSCTPATQCNKQARPKAVDPFAGLNLNDSQKAQLKALGEKNRDTRCEQGKAIKAQRAQCDSTARADRKAIKKQYLNDVKAMVGPEQYVIFLENFYVNGGDRAPQALKQQMKGNNKFQAQRNKNGKKQNGKANTNCRVRPNADAQAQNN